MSMGLIRLPKLLLVISPWSCSKKKNLHGPFSQRKKNLHGPSLPWPPPEPSWLSECVAGRNDRIFCSCSRQGRPGPGSNMKVPLPYVKLTLAQDDYSNLKIARRLLWWFIFSTAVYRENFTGLKLPMHAVLHNLSSLLKPVQSASGHKPTSYYENLWAACMAIHVKSVDRVRRS